MLSILPKFELLPISPYSVMLPKLLGPSMTPRSIAARPFSDSNRMMSAAALATSTPLDTEMPTSAASNQGASFMSSPR